MGVVYNTEEFGKEVKKARKRAGFTQKDLSESTGFSVSFISDLERGKPTVELGKAMVLLNMLGTDLIVKERG